MGEPVNKWRSPATGLAGMTSGVVEGVSAVGGGVEEVKIDVK